MANLKLTLLENSKRFVHEALQKAVLAETKPIEWQFAILSLVQAIELGLKELLRQQHPLLVFKNVDHPEHTVTLESAVQRLKVAANIEFESADLEAIRTAVRFRNQIVHYEFSLDPKDLKLVFAKLFGFLQEFFLSRLEYDLDSFLPKKLWMEGIAIHEYGAELFKRAEKRFEEKQIAAEDIHTCRSCGWDALSTRDREDRCYVCNHAPRLLECGRCQKIMYFEDADETISGKDYCQNCVEYLTDDYWHDRGR